MMSWGYWGIVGALVAMLAVLFVCLEILSRGERCAGPDRAGASGGTRRDAEPGTRHAA
jgi:hypothetical protein